MTIALVAVLVTLATGFVTWAHVVFPSPTTWGCGLPLAWREVSIGCASAASTDFGWYTFAIDAVFYMAIGCMVAVPFQRRRQPKEIVPPEAILSFTYVVLVLFFSISWYLTFCEPANRVCA